MPVLFFSPNILDGVSTLYIVCSGVRNVFCVHIVLFCEVLHKGQIPRHHFPNGCARTRASTSIWPRFIIFAMFDVCPNAVAVSSKYFRPERFRTRNVYIHTPYGTNHMFRTLKFLKYTFWLLFKRSSQNIILKFEFIQDAMFLGRLRTSLAHLRQRPVCLRRKGAR